MLGAGAGELLRRAEVRWRPLASDVAGGIVYLVGAGPGDPGLMTRRALELIARADAILYDRLIPAGALDGARADADLRYVGKKPGAPPMRRRRSTRCSSSWAGRPDGRAAEGRRPVRVRPRRRGGGGAGGGGRPVRGRPGVTAGVAAPAYAGIPVTHREAASAVALVTGHEDPAKDEQAIDWDALARFPGTLVFYMGVKRLPAIAARLVEAGRAADEPAAVVACGTLPSQRTVTGTLAEIADASRRSGDRAAGDHARRPGGGAAERLGWLSARRSAAAAGSSRARGRRRAGWR